jgi:hypothetical protein
MSGNEKKPGMQLDRRTFLKGIAATGARLMAQGAMTDNLKFQI